MKKHFTTFHCDKCDNVETWDMNTGYPYKKGWVYIYHFTIKKGNVRVECKDKHFCSDKCMVAWMRNEIKFIQKEKEKDEKRV